MQLLKLIWQMWATFFFKKMEKEGGGKNEKNRIENIKTSLTGKECLMKLLCKVRLQCIFLTRGSYIVQKT